MAFCKTRSEHHSNVELGRQRATHPEGPVAVSKAIEEDQAQLEKGRTKRNGKEQGKKVRRRQGNESDVDAPISFEASAQTEEV